jgi:hypothetical protein
MCDECDEAQVAPVLVGKMNRYGWRPPRAVPRCDEGAASNAARPAPVLDDIEDVVNACA